MVKDMAVFIVVALMVLFALRYVYHIRWCDARPPLSTWLIFLAGVCLGVLTRFL